MTIALMALSATGDASLLLSLLCIIDAPAGSCRSASLKILRQQRLRLEQPQGSCLLDTRHIPE